MDNKRLLALVIFVTALSLSGNLFCQENTDNDGFEPELGQKGKDVIWYPTPQPLVETMIDMAKLTSADFLIDLGSGDGRIVIAAAKRGIRAIGIEYNPDMVELSKRNAAREGVADKTDFIQADFYEYDLSKATVITMFLLPEINLKLRPKLLELEPGTQIITNTFSMNDWHFDEKRMTDVESGSWNTAYLWVVPAKVEGKWKCNEGELKLIRQYQEVSGNMKTGGKTFEISDGKLRGNLFSFVCNEVNYSCRADKNTLKGTAEKNGKVTAWEAVKQD